MTSFGKETFGSLLLALRPAILRFAAIQLRDETLTEDIVQETPAATWDRRRQFRREAGLKTWVMAILKNKTTDYFRRSRHSDIGLEGLQRENEAIDEAWRACFNADGHWLDPVSPAQWRPPEDYAEQQDFFHTLENCLGGLPKDTACIFYLREIVGMEVDEVRGQFDTNKDNCYVILHRVRNGLRRCLQLHWFDSDA